MDNANSGSAGKKLFGQLNFQRFLALAALVIIYVFFCIFGNNFLSTTSLINILDSSYYIGFLAIGVTFAIITGGIDLSIGTVMMTSALIGGVAYNKGAPIALALLICVISGALFGLLNGIIISKFGLVPFVATLGVQMVASGFGAIVSNVQTIRYPTVGTEDAWFKQVLYKTSSGFPIGIVWLVIFFIIAYVILNKMRMGRYTFALGSNEESARLSGVDVSKWKILVYVIVGAFTGMAGVMYAAAYTTIVPVTGAGMEILGIAAVVIGGTSLSGGVGSLTGTIIGVYIMAVLKQGLMSMGLQGHYQTFFTGIVVIAAVMLDIYRNKKSSKVKKA
ncbi:MAG: ABC transporter permease [Clostridiales bacterium]|jgi:ribose transport system permease protein|nr:ABC transporter permease [Clostridiales bacterium]